MAKRQTAEESLGRILYLLPAAARQGGASLAEVSGVLGVDRKQLLRDATVAYTRGDYMPAGQSLESQLVMDGEHLTLSTPGEFRRPARLGAREAAALGLGLRSLALESAPERRARLLTLVGVLESALVLPGAAETARDRVVAVHGEHSGGDAYERLRRAATERRRCAVRYLKPGAEQGEARMIDPYALIFAERWWYAVAFCRTRQEIRLFRVDRVLEVALMEERFAPPEGFDAAAHAPEGRAFVAGEVEEAVVRYSARIAVWIRERYPEAEVEEGGAVLVRHRVADVRWLVRHVLQYGADAEVLSPAPLRALVRESVLRRRDVNRG